MFDRHGGLQLGRRRFGLIDGLVRVRLGRPFVGENEEIPEVHEGI